jgi:hypothetical protein
MLRVRRDGDVPFSDAERARMSEGNNKMSAVAGNVIVGIVAALATIAVAVAAGWFGFASE